MSSRVNLNDNISDVFGFTIGGKDYDLKYPTMVELEPISDLTAKRDAAEKEGKTEEVAKLEQELTDKMYELIIPVGHSTPIQDVLKTQPFPVIKAFNKMVTEQFSAE